MLSNILSKIGLGVVGNITKELRGAYQDRLEAQNNQARIDADHRINTLKAQRDVLLAEQSKALTSWIRPAIALPFVVYLWKVVVWDKVLAWGATAPLSENLTLIMGTVLGAYFLGRPFEKWAKK